MRLSSLAIMKANEEVSKMHEQQQDQAGCKCYMPSCLINIEHIENIDLEPSSESLKR